MHSGNTNKKNKSMWTSVIGTHWQFAPVNIDERKTQSLSPCLALLCKQHTGILSDIQQAFRIIHEEFSFWLLVQEKTQENFKASPSHYILGSFMPAELALAFTLVWKHQDCPLSAIHSICKRVINPSGNDCEFAVQGPGLFTKKKE